MRIFWTLSVFFLSACATKPEIVIPDTPKIVRVTVKEYVRVPEELLESCYDENPREQTYGEALRLANLRKASVAKCNSDKAKIRALQPAKDK